MESSGTSKIRLAAGVVVIGCAGLAAGGTPGFSSEAGPAGLVTTHFPTINFSLSFLDFSPMTAGGAVGDFNNDGLQDLYAICGGVDPDRLYINQGDGTFVDEAAAWGVALNHMGLGVVTGDYNNDGWTDIYVTSVGLANEWPTSDRHILWRNNGDGTFTDVAQEAGVRQTGEGDWGDGFSAAFGDYDLDGDLDLAVAGWIGFLQSTKLFRNNGDGTFADVTETGVIAIPTWVRAFTPNFADMDGDRYPELLVAADFGTSRYFRNNADGTFTDVTKSSGTGLDGNGMGAAVGDVNGDGVLDWYVTSIWSLDSGMLGVPGTGNMLYMGAGFGHVYQEQSIPRNVNQGAWGWGTVLADIDNDADLDLLETNGWGQINGEGVEEWKDVPSLVWRNDGDGYFEEVGAELGVTDDYLGKGLVVLDVENDGDLDVVIMSFKEDLVFYRNTLTGSDINYLRLAFDTQSQPCLAPHGIGTRVKATYGGKTHVQYMDSRTSYLGNSEFVLHFGLAGAESVDELRIEWADGSVTTLLDVAANQLLTITARFPGDVDGSGDVGLADLNGLLEAFGASGEPGFAPADFNLDGVVDSLDLNITLGAYGTACGG